MGQVATEGAHNLAYLSRGAPITEPVRQLPRPRRTSYNASATYLNLIIGDGDNIGMLMSDRVRWMQERVARCKAEPRTCLPLEWSISPHTFYAAPDVLRWFLNKSASTGADWLILPPSGHLYSYPAMMSEADREAFIGQTERDMDILNTSGTVTWEWFTTWETAIQKYYPGYTGDVARGFFAVNVPYLFPVPEFGFSEEYKILGEQRNVVLFRPREWRGVNGHGRSEKTAEKLAAEINSKPKGSIIAIYTTSDGGLNMSDVLDMYSKLDSHVQVVDADTITHMALQRTAALQPKNILV
jgi:hypothetical protein